MSSERARLLGAGTFALVFLGCGAIMQDPADGGLGSSGISLGARLPVLHVEGRDARGLLVVILAVGSRPSTAIAAAGSTP